MNQSGFTANLVERFCHDKWDHTPDATPYQSGIPIDLIAPYLQTRMIHLLNFDVRTHIRVWLVALVDWPAPHAPISPQFILSSHHTVISQLQVT
jgi:hypothetical protein